MIVVSEKEIILHILLHFGPSKHQCCCCCQSKVGDKEISQVSSSRARWRQLSKLQADQASQNTCRAVKAAAAVDEVLKHKCQLGDTADDTNKVRETAAAAAGAVVTHDSVSQVSKSDSASQHIDEF